MQRQCPSRHPSTDLPCTKPENHGSAVLESKAEHRNCAQAWDDHGNFRVIEGWFVRRQP